MGDFTGATPTFRIFLSNFGRLTNIWVNGCGGNGVVMDTYAYPQHENFMKCLEYVLHGSVIEFDVVVGVYIAKVP